MRVTARTKEKTRLRILEVARNLFQEKGFSQTTTRDIATAASIAAGTMFNYFHTKEELALEILGSCLNDARAEFFARRRGDETLDELLFAHAAASLRHLRPHRSYVREVLGSGSNPYAKAARIAASILRVRSQRMFTFQAYPLLNQIKGEMKCSGRAETDFL